MRGFERSALLVSSAIVCVMATPAAAQTKSFDVPAQTAQSAIRQLGRQADVQIIAARKVTQGKQTKAVRGNLTVEQAMAQMFEGTGLVARQTGAGTWTIVPLASVSAASGAQQGQGQATLVGSVRDHKTGSALKGARVEVVETGASTSTGDLGDFRFTRLPSGDLTLRVSYLGFPEQTETVSVVGGLNNRADVYLGSGVTTEIVVIGQVSARAQALNQERTAENSTTVISGDLLGNFNGTTISDSLRRAPGVSFQQDPYTGDGTNIIVRGLSPDYNQVKLNGVALPEPSGTGRSANLNNLLSDSVSEIKISKTLLASQDSAGTGGLVEIETKSPLDRPKRYFNVAVEGTKRGKGFGEDYGLSATASLRFGADGNFGLSASYQLRKQDVTSYYYTARSQIGPYLPLGANGQPGDFSDIDPQLPFPFFDGSRYYLEGLTASSTRVESDTSNIVLSAAWQVSSGTDWRLDYNRSERTSDSTSVAYALGSSFGVYQLQPVPAEGGAERYVYGDFLNAIDQRLNLGYEKGAKSTTDNVAFRGTSHFGALSLDYRAGYARGHSSTPFSANGSFLGSVPVTPGLLAPEAIDPTTGSVITYFGPRTGAGFQAPLLSAAGFDALRASLPNRIGLLVVNDAQSGGSSNWNGAIDAKYEFGGTILRYIEAGLDYKRSRFDTTPSGQTYYAPVFDPVNGRPTLEDLDLDYADVPFGRVGGSSSLYRLPTGTSVVDLFTNVDRIIGSGLVTPFYVAPDALLGDQYTREDSLAGFVQARADIGKLEIIGGVRIERVKAAAGFASSSNIYDLNYEPDLDFYNANLRIIEASDVQTSYLPRVLMNWRPSEDLVLRAGYYSTIARPQISQITAYRTINYYAAPDFGPTGGRPALLIGQGNPALKSARTHNFDIGGEWYDGKVGVVKANIFYKRIRNLLESNAVSGFDVLDNVDLPDHPIFQNLPPDVFIELTYPVNNPDAATIWGAELAVERRLTFLPGILSGLGIYANYTYSRSKKTQTFTWFGKPIYDAGGNIVDRINENYTRTLPFDQSPKHSGTAGLTYSRGGFDGSLYYTAQARRFLGAGFFGVDSYNEATNSLDLRAVYSFKLGGHEVRASFEGLNLLKGKNDPVTQTSDGGVNGVPKTYSSGYYFGGRSFALGLSATF